MSFVWICKCGYVMSDKEYLSLGIIGGGIRETTKCPGTPKIVLERKCKFFLSDYKRMQGKDDHGRS